MIGAIWCQSANGVIGKDGKIPWHYAGDFKRFKRVTLGSTIGGAEVYKEAIPLCDVLDVTLVPEIVRPPPCTTCGHDFVFHMHGHAPCEGSKDCACGLYVGLTFAPKVDETLFEPGELLQHEDDARLVRRVYTRRGLAEKPYDLADNRRLQEAGSLSRRR